MKKRFRSPHVLFDILNRLPAHLTAVCFGLARGGGGVVTRDKEKHGPGSDSCLLEGGLSWARRALRVNFPRGREKNLL